MSQLGLVFDVYRDHWARENLLLRKRRYNNLFMNYFTENCSVSDVKSYGFESSPEGIFELLAYLKDWLLFRFGYATDFCHSDIGNHHRMFYHVNTQNVSQCLTRNVYAIVHDSTYISAHKRTNIWGCRV